jgi:hypothetical protein
MAINRLVRIAPDEALAANGRYKFWRIKHKPSQTEAGVGIHSEAAGSGEVLPVAALNRPHRSSPSRFTD